jgi:predicted AAA+ superfamily ATPase
MYQRNITKRLEESLRFSPVVLLTGARQTGKTTLVQKIAQESSYSYSTFDDLFVLSAAEANPIGFIEELRKPAILDEVQSVPRIFLPIKVDVDQHRRPGRYLLTGSANPLVVPKLGDSLAGRMQLVHLWPLSQGELRGVQEQFIDRIFADRLANPLTESGITKKQLVKMVIAGGYPALQKEHSEMARYQWCNGYLTTLIQKDLTDLSHIEHLRSVPNILKTMAARAGYLLNERDLARTVELPLTTTHRYVQLLQHLFLITFLPGWFRNLEKRIVKAPKLYFVDTAILLHLLGYNAERLEQNPAMLGHVIENFVIVELLKALSWSKTIAQPYHYRLHEGSEEVDLVLESTSGKTVGIEIKAYQTITGDDFRGLKKLKEHVGKEFLRGIVLYIGSKQLSFGPDLAAIPISALWAD